MKNLFKTGIVILIVMNPAIITAQVEDNFKDLNFTENPTWTGDTGHFKVNTSHQLQLKATGADTSYLSTQNSLVNNTEWIFWVKLSFNTSANNNARIYLVSDQENLLLPLNGYFLQVGGSNDSLSFFIQNGLQTEKLFQGSHTSTAHSTNILRIKVFHDSVGIWHLFSDTSGGTNFVEEGSCLQSQITTTTWFGVYCKYTSSNATKFYFDDFQVAGFHADTTPPGVVAVKVSGTKELKVSFSENVDKNDAEIPSHYSTVYSGNPSQVTVDETDYSKVTLQFQQDFVNGILDTLTILEIIDQQGNHSPVMWQPFCYYQEKSFDVVISEIMSDPYPSAGLPMSEYVELLNRTKYPISLKDWTFMYGVHSRKLPDTAIKPKEYLILTHGDSLKEYGPYISILASAASLSNEEDNLVLKNKSGKIIHSVDYSREWYRSSFKEEGGWSLEMIDPENPCGCIENWNASISASGGTPGSINSIHAQNRDNKKPYIKRARIIAPQQAELFFSESMDSLSLEVPNEWHIDHNLGFPVRVEQFPPEFNHSRLDFTDPFQQGILYAIGAGNGPKDCAGNEIDTLKKIPLALPDSVQPGDIVVNELLMNPKSGGTRFVEIYNRSQKALDLGDLLLSSADTNSSAILETAEVFTSRYLCFPGNYFVLTKNPADIQSKYYAPDPDAFIQLETFPSFADNDGLVMLLRKNDGQIIDEVRYSKSMQFPLLGSNEGVSLERISPTQSSDETGNWHSASESCGYATPGYQNSQFMEAGIGEDWVTLSPQIFSPDDDGKDDFVTIEIHPDRPGYLLSISVFDDKGKIIRQLVNRRLLASGEQITWDGIDNRNRNAGPGIYILYFEFLNPDGGKKNVKKAVVLARRF